MCVWLCRTPEHLLPLAQEVAHGSIWLGFDLISASGAERESGGGGGEVCVCVWGGGVCAEKTVRSECLSGLDCRCPPRLSLSEKFWLCKTSGARLKEKCCLWAISSLSTALTVSMTCRGRRVRKVSQAEGKKQQKVEWVEERKEDSFKVKKTFIPSSVKFLPEDFLHNSSLNVILPSASQLTVMGHCVLNRS